VAIPEVEIAAVRLMVSAPAVQSVAAAPYVATGDRVIVRRGPLAGLEGFVVYVPKGKPRVVVSVTMLGRSVSAEVDEDMIELLESALPVAA
jgi:transcription antitermination factor NusG